MKQSLSLVLCLNTYRRFFIQTSESMMATKGVKMVYHYHPSGLLRPCTKTVDWETVRRSVQQYPTETSRSKPAIYQRYVCAAPCNFTAACRPESNLYQWRTYATACNFTALSILRDTLWTQQRATISFFPTSVSRFYYKLPTPHVQQSSETIGTLVLLPNIPSILPPITRIYTPPPIKQGIRIPDSAWWLCVSSPLSTYTDAIFKCMHATDTDSIHL